ncbi:Hypothetical protein, putative [Bodo saltans]|uniref:Uncharacterized protein n=1 Tax=Bodo saltans TaxID=75058 RepID=A0A0S4J8K0_BODSA|nr:Hypothetical protein, putative [Bodo saltans]|eukprot:CUG86267.1 Hypothetical protein, putative [Bodo saltans]
MLGRLRAVGAQESAALSNKADAAMLPSLPSRPLANSQYSADVFSMDTPVKGTSSSLGLPTHATGSVDQQLSHLHGAVERATEEAELLKLAIFNDRVVREERQGVQDEEDAAVEERIRQAEAANDTMRVELQTLRSTMQKTVEMLEAIHQHDVRREMPAQFDEYELDRLVIEVQSTVERVRAEHALLQGRLESMELFAATEEGKRREKLAAIDEGLQRLEEAQKKNIDARKHLPFQPSVSDVSADWLKDAPGRHPTAGATTTPYAPPSSQPHNSYGAIASIAKTIDSFNAVQEESATQSHYHRRQQLEDTLDQFYAMYNPSKRDEVVNILDEYAGAEEELFAALEVHYGCFGYFSQ